MLDFVSALLREQMDSGNEHVYFSCKILLKSPPAPNRKSYSVVEQKTLNTLKMGTYAVRHLH